MPNIFKCLTVSAAICGIVVSSANAMGLAYRTAYSFHAAGDGATPAAGLVMDQAGMLCGTTLTGGQSVDTGTLFRFDPAHEALTVLHRFTSQDGHAPFGRLAQGPHNRLFGTLALDGAQGCGSVYELDTSTQAYTTLFSFSCGMDGGRPLSGVVADDAGILYGETSVGGAAGAGTIFSLNPAGRAMTVLHYFTNTDGDAAGGKLLLAGGALYGGSCTPGADPGRVFKLAPATGDMQTLYRFAGGAEGYCPGALVAEPDGTLLGTARYDGGSAPAGDAIFKLDPATGRLDVLHRFALSQGNAPADLTLSRDGNLFGARQKGGFGPAGSIFRLNPATGAFRDLDNLRARKAFAMADPNPGLVVDGTAIYGTTAHGGVGGQGSIFEIIQ